MKKLGRVWWGVAALLIAALPAGIAGSVEPTVPAHTKPQKAGQKPRPEPLIQQFIVKLRSPAAAEKLAALGGERMAALSASAGIKLQAVRAMSGSASVVAADAPMNLAHARDVAARLAADPAVEYAEPDMPVRAVAAPTDSGYAGRQWNMQVPGSSFTSTGLTGGTKAFTNAGGANFQNAWNTTTGSNAVIVAVIDTGVTITHPDLSAAIVPGSGYDFISSSINGLPANFTANDGDGRDADASDPGDWLTAAEKAAYPQCDDGAAGDTASSWHGTHMAGIIAAQWGGSAAGTSLAGAAPNTRIVPVRVLGKCGGVTSDVIDAMRWAAGLTTGLPANPNPAKVLNVSLGGGTCSAPMQTAVNDIIAANVTIVAAAGNDASTTVIAPASCTGVIAVTAHIINGENADYANIGGQVAISGPGGGQGTLLTSTSLTSSDSAYYVWSTLLFGPTTPSSSYVAAGTSCASGCTGPAISGFTGTSPATPHVSAAAALMLAVQPTATPAQLLAYLRASAQPHPAGGYCQYALNECGSGLLDANRAVQMMSSTAPVPNAGADQRVAAGATVNLTGSATPWGVKTITGYAWTQESGPGVVLAGAATQNASFTAPGSGTVVLRLTATDSAAVSGYAFTMVRVNVAPTMGAVSVPAYESVPLTYSLMGSDADFDALTYTVAPGSNLPGTATLSSGGTLSWSSPVLGTYTFDVIASDGLAQSAPGTVTLTVTTAITPIITAQPQNLTVNAGSAATFSVSATGTPAPTYQWQRNGVNISGATSATYTFTTGVGDNGAQYRVVVTNAGGSVTSNSAVLTVRAPSSSGGGALSPAWAGLLMMLAWWVRAWRIRREAYATSRLKRAL